MSKRLWLSLGIAVCLGVGLLSLKLVLGAAEPKVAAPALPPDATKSANSRIVAVTVYQRNALVTREVDVPEGAGSTELIVTPMPDATVEDSLYSEGSDNVRVLTTRFRNRPIKEDTREEVRKLEAEKHKLMLDAQKIKGDVEALRQNTGLLTKLEDFTKVTTVASTDKGNLNSDSAIALSKYVMEQRAEKAKEMVELEQKTIANTEQAAFVQRQLQELSGGSSKIERDALIVVDRKNGVAGKVRLNYLVSTASWHPQYKLRSGKEKEPVQVEYLAAVSQQSGEDWKDVKVTLSTAEPLLNSSPPELKTLEFAVMARGGMPPGAQPVPNLPGGPQGQAAPEFDRQAKDLRSKAQSEYNSGRGGSGGKFINDAAALEQCMDLFNPHDPRADKNKVAGVAREGQSVTYHLNTKLSVPSRNEEQVIEVTRLELAPEYYYKAVPVLTPHVYRLANLTNKSQFVLLPGEATTYQGTDFVGRMNMPLVAIDEQFTIGFGVDPALRVQRDMLDKARETKGGNQVLKFEYRILVSSFKAETVNVQVWDRLPHAENETAGVSLVKAEPEVCTDPLYVREERPNNLLRWDLKVDPTMNGEKAKQIKYEFRLEMDKQMIIGNVLTK